MNPMEAPAHAHCPTRNAIPLTVPGLPTISFISSLPLSFSLSLHTLSLSTFFSLSSLSLSTVCLPKLPFLKCVSFALWVELNRDHNNLLHYCHLDIDSSLPLSLSPSISSSFSLYITHFASVLPFLSPPLLPPPFPPNLQFIRHHSLPISISRTHVSNLNLCSQFPIPGRIFDYPSSNPLLGRPLSPSPRPPPPPPERPGFCSRGRRDRPH